MSRESELEEIKKKIDENSKKLELLIKILLRKGIISKEVDEIESLMDLSQESLKFLEDEPDIYSIKDIKKRYR